MNAVNFYLVSHDLHARGPTEYTEDNLNPKDPKPPSSRPNLVDSEKLYVIFPEAYTPKT